MKMNKTTISMPLKAFIVEHKKLIKILEKGMKKDLQKEAKEQSKELKKVTMKKK